MRKRMHIIGMVLSILALCFVIYIMYLEWGTQLVPLLFIMLAANLFHIYYYYKNLKK